MISKENAEAFDFETSKRYIDKLKEIKSLIYNDLLSDEKVAIDGYLLFAEALYYQHDAIYSITEPTDITGGSDKFKKAIKKYEDLLNITTNQITKLAIEYTILRLRASCLLYLGKYNILSADYHKAKKQFKDSIEKFDEVAIKSQSLINDRHISPENEIYPDYSKSFSFYAQSYLYLARSEEEALRYNYKDCAYYLSKRIDALKNAKNNLITLNAKLSEYWSKIFSQEIILTEKRQKNFEIKAKQHKKYTFSYGTLAFFIFTMLSIFLQLYLIHLYGQFDNWVYLIVTIISIIIGLLAAGLATWREVSPTINKLIGMNKPSNDVTEEK